MQGQSIITVGSYSFDNRYCIGQGAFGKVYKGKNITTQEVVAIKQLDRALVSQTQINKEIQILKSLTHPNIVKYEAALKTQQFFYIVTQFCNGGDLRNFFEDSDQSSEEDDNQQSHGKLQKLIDMFFQICEGFNYLHKANIIHRDLKPTNILIHNGIYKIADFGVARTQQLHKSLIHNDLIGVPIYMSPQILSKNFYSYKCDVWSLGIIMYQFYFQKLPWKATDVNALFFQIMSNPTPYLDQHRKLPNLLKCIFENTLQYLQKQRMSWEQLLGLKNKRKKIFDDISKSKNLMQKTKIYPYTDLSASKINKSVPKFQAQIVHHIVCQCQSLQSELKSLIGGECYQTFITTARNYLINGEQSKQFFIDCGFFMLKIAGQNLHLYMIDLQALEQARPVLILLELVHDLVTMRPNCAQQQFRKVIGNSYRSSKIDEYAASVISKINTYRLSEVRNF